MLAHGSPPLLVSLECVQHRSLLAGLQGLHLALLGLAGPHKSSMATAQLLCSCLCSLLARRVSVLQQVCGLRLKAIWSWAGVFNVLLL